LAARLEEARVADGMKARTTDCCSQHTPAPEWMDRLRGQAGRVTRSRREVLETLQRLRRPSTPKQILDAVAHGGCDLATVYRSMALFEGMGLVRRVDFGDGLARFEIADADPNGHHHHHLVCRACGLIVRLDDCILAEMDARLAGRYGFTEITHRLEFFGVCPKCVPTGKQARAGSR
jgi:Fe2+ or Zn2+ uptake regulation protein